MDGLLLNETAIKSYFDSAKRLVDVSGYKYEYERQRSVIGREWSETDFLREYSWVVLNSGFKEAVVRKWFPYISLAFFDFVSAESIVKHRSECVELALAAINHKAKIMAIADTSALLDRNGFKKFQKKVKRRQEGFLMSLPFIGQITSQHLLKNLGFDVAKNDRHLQRMSNKFEFEEAGAFCGYISRVTGEPKAVIDIILWRFAVLSSSAKGIKNDSPNFDRLSISAS